MVILVNPFLLKTLVKGCGVKYLRVVNPYDIKGMVQEVEKAYQYTQQRDGGMAVLIARYRLHHFIKRAAQGAIPSRWKFAIRLHPKRVFHR